MGPRYAGRIGPTPRLLIAGWEFQPYGGLETRVLRLLRVLRGRGWSTLLLSGRPLPSSPWSAAVTEVAGEVVSVQDLWSRTPRGRAAASAGLAVDTLRRRRLPTADERARLGHREFVRFVEGFWSGGSPGRDLLARTDVVLLVGAPKDLLAGALVAASGAGVPTAYQTVHTISADYVRRRPFQRFMAESHRCSLVVASSERQRQDLVDHMGHRGEVLVLPQWCYEDEDELLALEPPSGTRSGRLRVGSLSRFDEVKGLDVLIDAAGAAVDAGADLELVLGGSGDEEAALRRRGGALGRAGRMHLPGRVTDRPGFYGDVDVVAICSRAESGPITGVEAMAAARAIVSTPVGAMPERLEPERSGLFVEVDDVDGLARHLVRLAQEGGLAHRLGVAARRTYLDRYRRDELEARLVDALQDLSAGRPAASP